MQNLNIVVNDRVWPAFDVGQMSNWGMGYMPLKHLSLGRYGQNLKAIWHAESLRLVWTNYECYILHTSAVMHTFQNLNTAVNDKV